MVAHVKMNRAVILTALSVEYCAVRNHLSELREKTHAQGTVFQVGDFQADNGCQWEIAIAEIGPHNANAAVEAAFALDYFRPDVAFFVGVAGGIKDVRLGDVVAGTKVYGFESGKAGLIFQPRPEIGRCSHRMEQRARAVARDQAWLQRRLGPIRKHGPPTAFVQPIAAGEKVVAATRSDTYTFLRSQYSDAIAVEMEGLGFLEATHRYPEVDVIVIRGISDLIDDKERSDKNKWQDVAARNASAFAFEVLSKLKPEIETTSKCEWQIVLSGTVGELTPLIGTILEYLQEHSGDRQLTIKSIKPGSVVLTLEGSQEGFERIQSLFRSGHLAQLVDHEVLTVRGGGVYRREFRKWLRERRIAMDIGLEELADRLGCSSETIRKFEAGKRRPSKETAELLAIELGIPLEERPLFVYLARKRSADHVIDAPAPVAPDPLPHPPTNMHRWPTAFLGREEEVDTVQSLLVKGNVRLLTLTGPPGIGKTRLALEAAIGMLGSFPDGVYRVPLSTLSDPTQVIPTINKTLRLEETHNHKGILLLTDYIREQRLLFVLDHFEHLVDAASDVANLLVACPNLKVIVSSTRPLNVYSEHVFEVPPLSMPIPEEGADISLEALSQYDAIALFVERSQKINPDFQLSDENALVVAEICHQLDGLPLAIELAASRAKILSPQQILARLNQRLKLLTFGSPPFQSSMRAAIDWSYNLLQAEEKTLFRRMAAFVGGRSLLAVAAVCVLPGEELFATRLFEGVASLLTQSLLRPLEGVDGDVRFHMLWTIREYGMEQLAKSGEEDVVRQQHAVYFMKLAEEAESHITSTGGDDWLVKLDEELENMHQALEWCHSDSGDPQIGLRLAGALGLFWYVRGFYGEGAFWLDNALSSAGEFRNTVMGAKALSAAGMLANMEPDFSRANSMFAESLRICRGLADKRGVSSVLNTLASAASQQRDRTYPRLLLEESLEVCKQLQDESGTARVLLNLGHLANAQQDYTLARAFYLRSLAIFERFGMNEAITECKEGLTSLQVPQGTKQRAAQVWGAGIDVRLGVAKPLTSLEFVA